MAETQTLAEFYQQKFNWLPENLQQDIGHFNVFRLEDFQGPSAKTFKYSRRDFYKINLVRGRNVYHYADKSVELDGSTLTFFNPQVPYTYETLSETKTGFFCIFKEGFFTERMRGSINELPMFAPGGKPSYMLTEEQDAHVSQIFTKMLEEINSDYRYKYDLLMNYVTEMIHYALKLEPTGTLYKHPDAKSRITSIFTELLERQFPIESPSQRFTLRSAKDFADHLAVHVNHLNRAIKETTGKTTTEHISERLVSEAKALLKHTNWNVSEISYCLGFEEPAHFNNFFRKQTSQTPSSFRIV
ncbi:helix-turn-helix domain-containing protein [Chitinophaga pinensis]|uniref:Transcriptional regulator, AraC family n=1 Tax=Chitinophaga pinensis (strain ATCC 43595 / DSM 2588 / LMG 13176 / NBRC 15968 / NCIMB 11800 / UQM 2034) TaxID=485918 RepID=A0A979G4M4_CHIPD|nr:AraC family transcriptional regulator [Chitinophaga pinensis]ACU60765.1 transcriptional regulator, AraC family [Chitinophaga pinensis DSM 2588]